MAEWLGTALQKLLQRFESASDLKKHHLMGGAFLFFAVHRLLLTYTQKSAVYCSKSADKHGAIQAFGQPRVVT